MGNKEHIQKVQQYYVQSAEAYLHWGKDEEREGIYALHCGYEEQGDGQTHYESVKNLTRKIIAFSGIGNGHAVLDAGCGTGSIAYEVKTQFPDAAVFGINVASNQLVQADTYQHEVLNQQLVGFSQQDFGRTAFPDGAFDSVIFSESIAHAVNKRVVLDEMLRVLKRGGAMTIADVFLLREPENEEEMQSVLDATRGWFIPDLNHIEAMYKELADARFVVDDTSNISQNILPSALRMRLQAERRLSAGAAPTSIIEMSRKAVVAAHETVASGLVGYFLIHAKKG